MSAAEQGISDGAITFPFERTTRQGHYARPQGAGPFPGLVVIHEIYGLNENIRDVTRRFAGQGYAALAVDLFSGHNRALCMMRLMSSLALKPLDNANLHELKAALTFLGEQPEVDQTRLGAVGFCMGGGFAIAWACTDQRLKAIAPFYGTNPRPLSAVERSCPVVGSYPTNDLSTGHGQKLDAALTQYQIPHDIKTYPGAKHSFFNDQGANYNAEASADSWQRLLAFFGQHIG